MLLFLCWAGWLGGVDSLFYSFSRRGGGEGKESGRELNAPKSQPRKRVLVSSAKTAPPSRAPALLPRKTDCVVGVGVGGVCMR